MNKTNENGWKVRSVIVALATVIVILAAFIVYLFVKQGTQAEAAVNEAMNGLFTVIISIACSIIASVMGMWFFAAQDQSRDAQLVQTISETVSDIYAQNQSMTPKHFFCDTDMPHEKFNELLNEKIRTSENYSFIGDSARFTCERLYEMSKKGNVNPELKIQVILPDFRLDDIYSSKQDFFKMRERKVNFHNQRPVSEIIYKEKMKTVSCLYAVGKLKTFFDIEVYLIKEIPFMRIETAGDFLVLGFTQMQIQGKHYPPVMIYQDEKIFHQSFRAYIKENIERSQKLKKEELTAAFLAEEAQKAGISGVNENKVCEFYNAGCKSV